MNTSKIIKGVVSNGRYTVTAPIVKEDYGLYLQIEGVELPSTYEVDFSNSENSGTSVTMIGNSDGVLIPRQFISSGKDVFAFLYHVGEDYGRTVYKFHIPNKYRPDRTDEEPTPEEQSVIDQAINALNEAVAQTARDVIDADASAQSASADADRAEEARTDAQNYATQAEQSATDAQESASQASTSATASSQSAQSAEQSAQNAHTYALSANTASGTAENFADVASGYASQAQGYAQSASASAQSASGYASNAQSYSQTASAKAQDASGYAQTAADKATQAAQSASDASTQNTAAQIAKTAAETAKAGSESARDEAVAANTSAQQSESAMREILEEYSDVATEATAQEILRREEDGLVLMEFALRALDNRLDTMVEDLPHDTTGQQLAEALNFGNSMLNALYNELANEEV